jgi:hypothetical protein
MPKTARTAARIARRLLVPALLTTAALAPAVQLGRSATAIGTGAGSVQAASVMHTAGGPCVSCGG